jgi:pyruvate,water dikinase
MASMKTVSLVSVFRHFRRILALNNSVIEKIADMERALGGEYVFDRAFLRTAVQELNRLVREVIYNLNAMSEDRYLALYDRFEAIRNNLQDLLTGGPGPYGSHLTLPYSLLNRDMDHLTGAKNANLGEIRNSLGLRAPDGFAVTVAAFTLFMEENDLFGRIARLSETTPDRTELAARITELFRAAVVPAELETEISRQLQDLAARQGRETLLAVRSSAVGEDGLRSFAGQFRSLLNVRPEEVTDAYRQVVAARFSPQALDYLGGEAGDRALPMAVGIQQMVPARLAGVAYTRDPANPAAELLTVSVIAGSGKPLVSGETDAERYVLERHSPFPLVKSSLTAKPVDRVHADGRRPLDPSVGPLRRGSALLNSSQLTALAEKALLLEKAFDGPQDIEWALDDEGEVVILQSRRLEQPSLPAPVPAEMMAEIRQAVVLMQGRGQVAHLGVAAGPVIHVNPDADPADFPVGGIAVSRYASPQLAGIVRKAAALITDVGSPTGHLATIAREYRTPALFGTGRGSEILEEGLLITVDTEAKTAYSGVVTKLLELQASEEEPYQMTPEVRTLRRLLRWVAPIYLLAPDAPDFAPESCRTYHDLIRFSHEKAVENLIRLHSASTMNPGMEGIELETAFPLKLRMIDLDGGLEPHPPGTARLGIETVRSRPLQALLRGLNSLEAWSREGAPLGLKDLFSSMARPLTSLAHAPQFSGENLALVAASYCNLTLRLGYHFNVIDSYLSDDPDDNYIYFRFVGGVAEQAKRDRRAALIAGILASLQLKVDLKGDLLIGKAKMLAPEHMDYVLTRIGELIAFTRQLDVRMVDDQSVELFFGRFLERTKQAWPGEEG